MKKICIVLLVILACVLSSCGKEIKSVSKSAASITYEVFDDTGRKLTFNKKPERIVSLTYGTDEILTELVDLKRMVAFSRWAGDSEISFITKEQAFAVGCKVADNLEAILKLEPDLVVASVATSNDVVQSLENIGIPVYIVRSPHNYQEMCAKIKNLAAAVGESKKGDVIIKNMDNRLHNLEVKLSHLPSYQRKVAVAFNFTSAIGRKGDLLDSILTMAHVINGAAAVTPPVSEHKSVVISKEMVVTINPDIFLLPTWNYNNKQDVQGYYYEIMNDPAYKNVKAVQNRQLKFVSDKYRYVASQHIVDAVEKIARTVYPELF